MKTPLSLLALLLFASSAFAQFADQVPLTKLNRFERRVGFTHTQEPLLHTTDYDATLGLDIYEPNGTLLANIPMHGTFEWEEFDTRTIILVSRTLFNTDNNFEAVILASGPTQRVAYIINQDGSIDHSFGNATNIWAKGNVMTVYYGTDSTVTYQLAGSMPTAKQQPSVASGADPTELSAYPNPTAHGQITLTCTPLTSAAALRVVSPQGQVVHQTLLPAGTSDYKLSTNSLAPGAYRYYIEQGGQRTAAKAFVVK